MTCAEGSKARLSLRVCEGVWGARYLRPEVETLQKSGRVGPAVGIRRARPLGVLWLHLLLLLAVQVAQMEVDLGSQMELLKRHAESAVLAVRGHEGCRASRWCVTRHCARRDAADQPRQQQQATKLNPVPP